MFTSIFVLAAVVIGIAIGFLWGKATGNGSLQIQIAELRTREQAQLEKYEQMKADLDSTFATLAANALNSNHQTFLSLARSELGVQTNAAAQKLEDKEQAIKVMLDPLNQTLKNLDAQAKKMEEQRAGAYAEVSTMVKNIQQTIPASIDSLKNETAQLISALRSPKTRGNWGELQLKRCVEYAGMVQYCSFSQQVSVNDDEGRQLRPDMTIQLPNGREIVVDAKTPLDAFLEVSGSMDPADQKSRFQTHALRVRAHLKELSAKAYWKQFDKAPDFVVCFLPSEALFSAALEADPSLIEFGVQNNVVMATPTTFIALLRAVEYGWQQSEITKSAKKIHELGSKLYEKLVVAQGHVLKLGSSLSSSIDNYNKFVRSIEGKGGAFSYGRQLGALVHSDNELSDTKQLENDSTRLDSEEWSKNTLELAANSEE